MKIKLKDHPQIYIVLGISSQSLMIADEYKMHSPQVTPVFVIWNKDTKQVECIPYYHAEEVHT